MVNIVSTKLSNIWEWTQTYFAVSIDKGALRKQKTVRNMLLNEISGKIFEVLEDLKAWLTKVKEETH